MPNQKSAEKRVRQNERRRVGNGSSRTKLRTSVKIFKGVLSGGDAGQVGALLPQTISEIDKAVQKGVLHRNAAARHKSRLTARANKAAAK